MNIDYVVIASDNNPLYRDFYVPVSKIWNHFGYNTFMLEICDEESEIGTNQYGLYKKIKSVHNNTGLQSQVVRLYASNILKEKNLLISDIDMFCLNIEYFEDRARPVKDDEILIYSGQPYSNPFFPMCYVLANGRIMSDVLGITNKSFDTFISELITDYNGHWRTDENFIYDKLSVYPNLTVLRDRDFSKRVDRRSWKYDDDKVKNGYYIDSHSIRPFKTYKDQIDRLINIILND